MSPRRTVPTEPEATDQPGGGEDPTNEASSPPSPTFDGLQGGRRNADEDLMLPMMVAAVSLATAGLLTAPLWRPRPVITGRDRRG